MAQLHILLASFISFLGCVVAIFTPWLNYSYDMSFGPIAATPPIKGPTILVGLFKCFSEVCETFNKVSSSPEKFKVPVQFKDSSPGTVTLYRVTDDNINGNPTNYNTVFTAVLVLGCLILSLLTVTLFVLRNRAEFNCFETPVDRLKRAEIQFFGSFMLIVGCLVYSCTVLYSLNDAHLDIGYWVCAFASVISLVLCLYDEDLGARFWSRKVDDGTLQSSSIKYGNNYGSVNP